MRAKRRSSVETYSLPLGHTTMGNFSCGSSATARRSANLPHGTTCVSPSCVVHLETEALICKPLSSSTSLPVFSHLVRHNRATHTVRCYSSGRSLPRYGIGCRCCLMAIPLDYAHGGKISVGLRAGFDRSKFHVELYRCSYEQNHNPKSGKTPYFIVIGCRHPKETLNVTGGDG